MYGSYTPEQMGLRQSAVWKREGDNLYVFPRTRSRRVMAGPAVKRDAKGKVLTITPAPKAPPAKALKFRAITLKPEHAYGRPCRCSACSLAVTRRAGTVEHATKDHL